MTPSHSSLDHIRRTSAGGLLSRCRLTNRLSPRNYLPGGIEWLSLPTEDVMTFRIPRTASWTIVLVGLLVLAGLTADADTVPGAAPQLHVSGNRLVDANGSPVVLRGVDRSGSEYQCVQGRGI